MRVPTRAATLSTVILALSLALPSAVSAQAKYFGVVGGANLSDLSDEFGVYDTKDKWGMNLGLVLGIRTANWMSLSVEPAWSQMGGADGSIDYLETPVLVGGLARSGDKTRWGGYSGIVPAFQLNCSIEQRAGACDDLKGSSWFLPLGLRFYREAGANKFVGLDVRYLIPLGSSFESADVNQRSWAFRLVFVKGDL